MSNVNGTPADETLNGTTGADVINEDTTPRSGSDTVNALAGDDVIYAGTESGDSSQVLVVHGGDGNDAIHYNLANPAGLTSATFTGDAGNDTFYINDSTASPTFAGTISIDGGAGTDLVYLNDPALALNMTFHNLEGLVVASSYPQSLTLTLTTEQITSLSGNITLTEPNGPSNINISDGGSADLTRTAQAGLTINTGTQLATPTILTATPQNDTIYDNSAGDTIHGGAGDDTIYVGFQGTPGGNQIYGDAGNDSVAVFPGGSHYLLDGGAGTNTLSAELAFSNASFSTDAFATAQGLTLPDGSTIRNFQNVSLTIQGDNNVVHEGVNGGSVSLIGANTVAYGGPGSDILAADTVYITPGGADNTGGSAFTSIDYSSAAAPVHMDSITTYQAFYGEQEADHAWIGGTAANSAGSSSSVTFLGDATVIGSAFNDTLVGDLHPGDMIVVNLYGGAGDDTITPGLHGSILDGGTGVNTLSFDNPAFGATPGAGVTVDLSVATAQATGYGSDTLTNFQNVVGSAGNDHINGSAADNVLSGGAGNDILNGAGGNDTLIGGPGDDILDGGSGDNTAVFAETLASATVTYQGASVLISGPDGSDTVTNVQHFQFSDGTYDLDASGHLLSQPNMVLTVAESSGGTLTGGAGDDTLTGGPGPDTLIGGGGSDRLIGGGGVDTALYAGLSHSYAIALHGGSGTVSGGPEGGADTLSGIDDVSFLEGTLTFDPASVGAQVVRLYESAFERAPDAQGFDVYFQALQSGRTSLVDVATLFLNSAEGQGHYASTQTDSQFVTSVYETVLGRAPDTGGAQYYTSQLDSGALSRGQFLVTASESSEHQADMAALVAAGIWEGADAKGDVIALYDASFGRLPDGGGLGFYSSQINSGTSLATVANELTSSAEFDSHYGLSSSTPSTQTDKAFVDSLYEDTLHRAADPGGEAFYSGQLDHGASYGQVVLELAQSTEHQALLFTHVDYGLFG